MDGGQLILLDVTTGKTLYSRDAYSLSSGAFSPDGKHLAIVVGDVFEHDVRVCDASSGKERLRLKGELAKFSPDGQTLATISENSVQFWDPKTGKMLRTITIGPPEGYIADIAFSPDSRHLATANSNGTVYLLRLIDNLGRQDFE